MASERSARYKRRGPTPTLLTHPLTHSTPNPLAVPSSPFRASVAVSTAATKTTNYCKTSQITFQLTSSHCKPRPINKAGRRKHTHTHTHTHTQIDSNGVIILGSPFSVFGIGKWRKDPCEEILSFPISISHNICLGNAEHQAYCMQTPSQQHSLRFPGVLTEQTGIYI